MDKFKDIAIWFFLAIILVVAFADNQLSPIIYALGSSGANLATGIEGANVKSNTSKG